MNTTARWMQATLALAALAMTLGMAVPAAAYHETLYVTVNGTRLGASQIRALEQAYGTRIPSGNYRYDPATGRLFAVGAVSGSEQLYRGPGRQDQGWRNPAGRSSGYSNHNTGTNVICDSGGCNIAR